MGRSLTQEEKAQFEKEREEQLIEFAKRLGLPIEKVRAFRKEMQELEEKAREELIREIEADTITDEEFSQFVNEQCDRFSEELYKDEFRRIAEKHRANHSDDIITLRKELELTANSMLKSEQFNKRKER